MILICKLHPITQFPEIVILLVFIRRRKNLLLFFGGFRHTTHVCFWTTSPNQHDQYRYNTTTQQHNNYNNDLHTHGVGAHNIYIGCELSITLTLTLTHSHNSPLNKFRKKKLNIYIYIRLYSLLPHWNPPSPPTT